MKPKDKTIQHPVIIALAFAGFAASSALAAPLTWSGATDGTWGTSTNWTPDQVPAPDDTLTILGPSNMDGALTINISDAASGGSINFNSTSATSVLNTTSGTNQTLTLGSASVNGVTTGSGAITIGSITANQGVNVALGANQTWTVGAGALSVVNTISGAFSLTKEGNGALQLGPLNTGTGPTNSFVGFTLNAGSAEVAGNNVLGSGSLTINGGTLNARGVSRTFSNNAAIGGNFTLGGASQGANAITLSGTADLAGGTRTITVDATGNAVMSGIVSNGGLVKSGSGRLDLTNASNSYAGTTTIQNGTLLVTSTGALGTGASAIALGNAISISSDFSPTLKVNGNTNLSRNVIVGASNAATAGTYTINSDNGASALTISGTITLNQNLTVSSAINTNGTTATLSGSITSGATGTQTLTLNNTAINGFNRRIAVTGTIGGGVGTIALIKAGQGLVQLTTAHTFTGDARIAAGTLQIDANSLGVTTQLQNSTLDMTTGDTGVLEFRGSTGTTAVVLGGLKGSRTLSLQNTSGIAVAFTVGGNNQSTAYSGALTGSGSLTKTGTGTLTLSGTNTYFGTTTVSTGTLAFENGSQASPMTVNNGASLGFTLGSGTTSTGEVTFDPSSTVKITGTPTLASYTLMTASSIVGTPVLDAPIAGYQLAVTGGNTLVLNQTGASGYSQWASSKGLTGANNGATQDPNQNGTANLVEYVLNGDPLFAESPAAILPTLNASGANFVFTFTRRVESAADTTQIFEYGTTLTGWTALNITAPTDAAVNLGTPSGGTPNLQTVTVTIPKAPNTKLFGRLRVVK